MPIIKTKGSLSSQGYGFSITKPEPAFIQDVFATSLYNGSSAEQSVVNNVALAEGATSPGWILTLTSNSSQNLILSSITVDSSNNVFVGGSRQFYGPTICKFNSNGVLQFQKELSSGNGSYNGLGVDSSNNVYASTNTNSIRYIVKHDNNGNILWQRALSTGTNLGIAVTSGGDVYASGYVTVSSYERAAVNGYNSSGTLLFQNRLSSSSTNATYFFGAGNYNSSTYAVCGLHNNGSTGDSSILTALYNGGSLIWYRLLNTPSSTVYDYGSSATVDLFGNIYAVGYIQFPPKPFICKYNSSGTLQWQRTLSITSVSAYMVSVTTDSSGNVYAMGEMASSSNTFIAKYNSSGVLQWQRSIRANSSSNVIVTGYKILWKNNYIYLTGQIGTAIGGYSGFVCKLPDDGSGTGNYILRTLISTNTSVAYTDDTQTDAVASLVDPGISLTTGTTTSTATTPTFSYSNTTYASTIQPTVDQTDPPQSFGGLVWIKQRSGTNSHALFDFERGPGQILSSNTTGAQSFQRPSLIGFMANGFRLGSFSQTSGSGDYVSWSFRNQSKFFDIVTYTGTGVNRTISHNLKSVPGCIIIKSILSGSNWSVYHNSIPNTDYVTLNLTSAKTSDATFWNSTSATSTEFSLGTNSTVNNLGTTYVAYLFASNAGGFGASGTENVISCGSYTGNGSSAFGPTVTLGYEPQWLMIKRVDSTGDWNIIDNKRGFVVSGTDAELVANLSDAETTGTFVSPLSTGFSLNTTDAGYNASGGSYIYMAVKKSP